MLVFVLFEIRARSLMETAMPNITFRSPTLKRDKTVYAIAGDARTILTVAEESGVRIPHDCRDGNCGSCLIEVDYDKPSMKQADALTEKEKFKLKEIGKLTAAEIEEMELSDLPPKYRLACQFIARDENVRIVFSGEPGGA